MLLNPAEARKLANELSDDLESGNYDPDVLRIVEELHDLLLDFADICEMEDDGD